MLRRLAQSGSKLIIAQASGYNTHRPEGRDAVQGPDRSSTTPPTARQDGVVADVETSSQEGAYLAGVLAAKMTKTGTLGIVISAADTNWFKQAGGFVAGARSRSNPDVKFQHRADRPGGLRRRGRRQARHRAASSPPARTSSSAWATAPRSGCSQAVETAKPPAGASKVWFIDVIGDKTKVDKKGVLLSSVLWDFTAIFTQAIADVERGDIRHDELRPRRSRNGLSLLKTNKAPAERVDRDRTLRRRASPTASIKVPTTTERAVNKSASASRTRASGDDPAAAAAGSPTEHVGA